MNIGALSVGKGIKNYKEMCILLECEAKKGTNSRKAHMKEIERFIKLHKEGYGFIVEEIYDEPKEKVDKRKGNSGKSEGSRNRKSAKYIKNIEKLILNLLIQNNNKLGFGKVFLSKNKILSELKMINENYAYCKQRTPKLSKFMNIPEETVEEWYDSTNSMLIRNLENALDNLKSQRLILWTKEISVAVGIPIAEIEPLSKEIIKTIHINEYNEEVADYTYSVDNRVRIHYREGTEEEKTFILYTEREVLKELKCKSEQEVIRKGLWKTYLDKVNKIVLKELNILFYYNSYKLLFNENHVYEAVEDLYEFELSEDEKTTNEQILNKEIINRNTYNTERKHNRAVKEKEKIMGNIKEDDTEHKKIKRRINENYIRDNENLNNNLINISAISIRNKVKKTFLEN